MSKKRESNAIIRTTTAITILNGGIKVREHFSWQKTRQYAHTLVVNLFFLRVQVIGYICCFFQSNVVPPNAYAIVNHRVHPGQSLEDVVAYDKAIIADDQIEVS